MENGKPDLNGDVRTVIFAVRPQNRRDLVLLPYAPKQMETFPVGVEEMIILPVAETYSLKTPALSFQCE